MIAEKDGKFIHDEHDVTIKISNDNTKFVKQVTITVRSDGDAEECLKLANKLYKDGLGS